MRSPRHTGQAAVEGIGIALVVALLLAATAAWLVGASRGSRPPPAVLDRVAAPLRESADPGLWSGAPGLPVQLRSLAGRSPGPIGRALGAAARGVATGVVVGLEARHRFLVAYADRLRERGGDFLRNPLGYGEDLPDESVFTPRGAVVALAAQAGELWDYGIHLRSLPPRVAIMTASEDLGRVAGDVSIQAAKVLLRRWLVRAGGRGAPPPGPGTPSPAP